MTDQRESILIWALVGLIVLGLMVSVASAAEPPPCRNTGSEENPTVTCDRRGFDVLVKKLIDSKATTDSLKIQLDAAEKSGLETKAALDACLAKPEPKTPTPPSAQRAIAPVIVAALGAAVLTTSVAIDLGATGRVAGAVVGLAAVGVGIVLALP